jgi:hypothetical protein
MTDLISLRDSLLLIDLVFQLFYVASLYLESLSSRGQDNCDCLYVHVIVCVKKIVYNEKGLVLKMSGVVCVTGPSFTEK